MTVKEMIHSLIDELPDADANLVLAYLGTVANKQSHGSELPIGQEKSEEPAEWLKLGRPTTADDPLWNIVGIIDDEGPTDVARNHDAYLAEAYSDWKKK